MSDRVSDDRLEELRACYQHLADDKYGSNPDRKRKDTEHASLMTELQNCRRMYCPACRGDGFVPNPELRWDIAEDGAEYNTGDEEIDCPECHGLGFKKPRKPTPVYQQVERDDGMPF